MKGSRPKSTFQKSTFLDRVLGRIGRLDTHGLQTVIERLARERTFLETVFNAIEDGVLVLDEGGRILYLNSATTHLLGLQASLVEGQHISKYLNEVDWEKILSLDAAGGQRIVRHEFEIAFPRPRFIRMYAAPLDGEHEGPSGIALILHDATEARQQTFEAIETERLQALTLLAASVAHEIGNPLNALHIHLQLMERELRKLQRKRAEADAPPDSHLDSATEKLESYVRVAKGEINRLDYIITDFLQALRPRAPKLELRSLNEVIEETAELLRPELENRGVHLALKPAGHLPKVPLDPAQIKQALVNVVKNAMQATGRGGEITIQTGTMPDGVSVLVKDTGAGMSPEQLKRIFEPFFTTKKKGTGLGLMIVQRIVRDHGGRIDIDSRPGEGTSFRIWLPALERAQRLLSGAPQAAARLLPEPREESAS
ncbi:MAG TPA: ATP-binding protein [Methylomirabilota bacterium]|nr:ATP-binding protein [Methylomirabilota bacterium]